MDLLIGWFDEKYLFYPRLVYEGENTSTINWFMDLLIGWFDEKYLFYPR